MINSVPSIRIRSALRNSVRSVRALKMLLALGAATLTLTPAAGAPGDQPSACEIHTTYDEYMQFDVSYMHIGIGSVEMYMREGTEEEPGCGLTVMESFPNIGFLRVYSEYLTTIAEDGYFIEAHLWNEVDDHWEYELVKRNPRSHLLELSEGVVDTLYELPDTPRRVDMSFPDEGVHDATSLVAAIRRQLDSGKGNTELLYDEGRIEPVPFRIISRDGMRNVAAFGSAQPSQTVEVELNFEGIHGLRDALIVEFTRDSRAVPLYAEAAIVIGRIRLELVDYKQR